MKKLVGATITAAAVALAVAPAASADSSTYFDELYSRGNVVWDYPSVLSQGYTVCDLLWEDINPMPYLTDVIGYDTYTASTIVASARVGLCPGNAITQSPPQLQYAL